MAGFRRIPGCGDAGARADGSMIWLDHGEHREYETVFRFLRH
jgi:hypothetical protein